jgi:pyocin large subunit-like protein
MKCRNDESDEPMASVRFESAELAIHHAKHGADFGMVSEGEYEDLARRFLTTQSGPDLKECTRQQGDLIRYNPLTQDFGVLAPDGFIRTYFKPVPCRTLPPEKRVNCHNYADNIEYFERECKRTW